MFVFTPSSLPVRPTAAQDMKTTGGGDKGGGLSLGGLKLGGAGKKGKKAAAAGDPRTPEQVRCWAYCMSSAFKFSYFVVSHLRLHIDFRVGRGAPSRGAYLPEPWSHITSHPLETPTPALLRCSADDDFECAKKSTRHLFTLMCRLRHLTCCVYRKVNRVSTYRNHRSHRTRPGPIVRASNTP